MLLLTAEDVRKALPMKEAISAMKDAYTSLQRDSCCAASDTPTPPKQRSPQPVHASLCPHK